jgi:hypothetical protein
VIKKITTLLILAILFFCSIGDAQNVSAGGGGGIQRLITIPAAAFRPQQAGFTYINPGFYLEHSSFGNICPTCEAYYFAPVHLPHYAVITGLVANFQDLNPTKTASVDLVEANLAAGNVSSWIGTVSSPVGTNSGFTYYSLTGLVRTVDNENHAYYLRYRVPEEQTSSDEILLGGVQIKYVEGLPANPSFFSITGADFTPFSQQNSYSNSGARVEMSGSVVRDFQAGINLPNGARIDRMTFYYYGAVGNSVSANLCKTNLSGDYINLNSLTSALAAGSNYATSTVFTSNRVDNTTYAYWLYYRFANGPIPYGVAIEYTPKIYSTYEQIFTIPAASFVPREGNYTYENHGRYIIHSSGGDSDVGSYLAPIAPPPDSSITFMNFLYGNSPGSNPATLKIFNVTDQTDLNEMWTINTLTTGGWYAYGSGNIAYNPFDYRHNSYYLRLNISASTVSNWVWAIGGKGEWAYRNYLPRISK